MALRPATLASGNRIPFLRRLGITLAEIGERHAVMRVRLGGHHRNYFGGVHGGLIATLVDTVSFFPRPLLPSGREVTTTTLSVTYLRAPRLGDVLTARSELLHLGRRTAAVRVAVEDQAGRLVAHGTVSLLVLAGDAGAPSPRTPPARAGGSGAAVSPRTRRRGSARKPARPGAASRLHR